MEHQRRSQARGGEREQAQLASKKMLEGGQLRSRVIIGHQRILIIAAVNQIPMPMLHQVGRSVSRLRRQVELLGRSTEVASHYRIGSKVGHTLLRMQRSPSR